MIDFSTGAGAAHVVPAYLAALAGRIVAAGGGGINLGHTHVNSTDALPYLAAAYALFFVVIFAYAVSLSRRQARVQSDIALLRRVLDEESDGTL